MIIGPHQLRAAIAAFIFISLIGAPAVWPQDAVKVTAEGSSDTSCGDPDKTRDRALAAAEQNALVTGLAAGITPETLLINFKLSGSMLSAIPYGKVLRTQILQEGWVKPNSGNSRPENQYRVQLEALVAEENVEQPPSFYLNARLNQSIFKDGDELKIHLHPTKACYFAILNILEGNQITALIPNASYKKNRLAADEEFTFPSQQDRNRGFKIRVHLPENKTAAAESIYIIALLQPFCLTSEDTTEKNHKTAAAPRILLQELIRTVIGVPPRDRADTLLPYRIQSTIKKSSMSLQAIPQMLFGNCLVCPSVRRMRN